MRIAHVTSALLAPLGGAEQYCLELTKWQQAHGNQVTIYTSEISPTVQQELSGAGLDVQVAHVWRPYPGDRKGTTILGKLVFHCLDLVQAARPLDALFESPAQFDVVHVHRFQGYGLGVLRSRRFPIVHTTHDHALVDTRTTTIRDGELPKRLGIGQRARTALVNLVIRSVDRIIFPTERLLSRHHQLGLRLDDDQPVVIHHGWRVDLPPAPQRRDPDDPVTFLFMGSLSEEKGLLDLLEAWGEGLPGARLEIAGAGDLEGVCAQLSGRRGIEFRGWLEPVARGEALRGANCLVAPSHMAEAFGLVVAEGLLAGLPVIVSRIAASELVEDGKNGLIVASTPADIRVSLDRFTNNPSLRKTLTEGTERCRNKLDFDHHGRQVMRVYSSVALRNRSGSRRSDV